MILVESKIFFNYHKDDKSSCKVLYGALQFLTYRLCWTHNINCCTLIQNDNWTSVVFLQRFFRASSCSTEQQTQAFSSPTPTKYTKSHHKNMHNRTQNRSSKCGGKQQTANLISSHPGLFVSTWSLPVISQLLSKLFNHAHVWKHLNTADTTPGKVLSCTEPRADTVSENQTLRMNE